MVDSPKLHPPSKKVKHLSTSGYSRYYVIRQYLLMLQTIIGGFRKEKDKIMTTTKVAAAESKAAINC